MFWFHPIEMRHAIPRLGRCVAYGILVERQDGTKWVPVTIAADVSYDPDVAAQLAEACTRQQLDPERLVDVISDFLEKK